MKSAEELQCSKLKLQLETLFGDEGCGARGDAMYGLSLSENAYEEWSRIWIDTSEEVLAESEVAYRNAIIYIDEFLRG